MIRHTKFQEDSVDITLQMVSVSEISTNINKKFWCNLMNTQNTRKPQAEGLDM